MEKSSRLEKIKENKELWSEFWLEELVSDIIGVSLGGPAYLKMLILETCDYNPVATHDIAHPPLDARAFTQIRYLEHVGAPSELVSRMKEEWKAFRNGISEESPLQEAFNEDLLNAIAQKLTEFIPHPFIVTKIFIALRDLADKDEIFSSHDLIRYFERDQPSVITLGSYLSRIEKLGIIERVENTRYAEESTLDDIVSFNRKTWSQYTN